jgi:hypothetical protein
MKLGPSILRPMDLPTGTGALSEGISECIAQADVAVAWRQLLSPRDMSPSYRPSLEGIRALHRVRPL